MTGSHPYLEVSMTAHSKVFSTMTKCFLLSFAMAILGVTWGCGGGVPSEAKLDAAAQAEVQKDQEIERNLMEKRAAKAPKGRTGRLSKKDLEEP